MAWSAAFDLFTNPSQGWLQVRSYLTVACRWTGAPAQGVGRPSAEPHLAPGLAPRPVLHPIVCTPSKTKTPHLRGFREIAGAGFEPATFGL